jgi:hypothetical protein
MSAHSGGSAGLLLCGGGLRRCGSPRDALQPLYRGLQASNPDQAVIGGGCVLCAVNHNALDEPLLLKRPQKGADGRGRRGVVGELRAHILEGQFFFRVGLKEDAHKLAQAAVAFHRSAPPFPRPARAVAMASCLRLLRVYRAVADQFGREQRASQSGLHAVGDCGRKRVGPLPYGLVAAPNSIGCEPHRAAE